MTIAILVSIAAVAVDATFDLAWLAPLGVVGSFVAALGLASRLGSRVGTVQFRADRIEVDPDGLPLRDPRHVVAWDDLVGWRSRSDVSLELALRARLARGRGPPTNVPTITPEVRAAVEALLASRGVPRLEG